MAANKKWKTTPVTQPSFNPEPIQRPHHNLYNLFNANKPGSNSRVLPQPVTWTRPSSETHQLSAAWTRAHSTPQHQSRIDTGPARLTRPEAFLHPEPPKFSVPWPPVSPPQQDRRNGDVNGPRREADVRGGYNAAQGRRIERAPIQRQVGERPAKKGKRPAKVEGRPVAKRRQWKMPAGAKEVIEREREEAKRAREEAKREREEAKRAREEAGRRSRI